MIDFGLNYVDCFVYGFGWFGTWVAVLWICCFYGCLVVGVTLDVLLALFVFVFVCFVFLLCLFY